MGAAPATVTGIAGGSRRATGLFLDFQKAVYQSIG
jgi:hypothetical protein